MSLANRVFVWVFFFQAEDGIRYGHVTGVQTCALPILAHAFKPDIEVRACKYIWLGTRAKFDDAFTFIFEETPQGWIWAHAYQFDPDTATFIVECSEATWRRFGFDRMSADKTIAT